MSRYEALLILFLCDANVVVSSADHFRHSHPSRNIPRHPVKGCLAPPPKIHSPMHCTGSEDNPLARLLNVACHWNAGLDQAVRMNQYSSGLDDFRMPAITDVRLHLTFEKPKQGQKPRCRNDIPHDRIRSGTEKVTAAKAKILQLRGGKGGVCFEIRRQPISLHFFQRENKKRPLSINIASSRFHHEPQTSFSENALSQTSPQLPTPTPTSM